MKSSVAILVPVYNHLEYTKQTLKELSIRLQNVDYKIHIVLIDDGSTDGTSKWVEDNFPDIIILKGDGNLWWSGAINMGAKYAITELRADYLLLFNNDVQIDDNYFPVLFKILAEDNSTTLIGSKIYVSEQPDLLWSMGGYFNPKTGRYGMFGYYEKDSEKYNRLTEVDWLTGMGTLIPGKVIESIGYWDNINFPQYHGDSDYTYRAKLNGFKVIVHPSLKMYNSVKNSGIEHEGSIKQLIRLLTDVRSKCNLKKNLKFYHLYASSLRAYLPLIWLYFQIVGGFFKWKILKFFNFRKSKIRT
jgi:GT2 family glycosyltransferase